MKIEMKNLDALTPCPRNPRTHSPDQIHQLVKSIKEFGFTNPILIDAEGEIIAGHGRWTAARAAGLTEVPTITLAHLTPAQRQALVIADNKLALNAGWDETLLAEEMKALELAGFDLSVTGFSDDEINGLMASLDATGEGETDDDEIPAIPVAPVSKQGDIWKIGRHRVRCGDSTKAEDVTALLAGVEPHLMVTDPPYGVEYDPSWRVDAGVNKNKKKQGKVQNDDRASWREAYALFPGTVAYVWHGDKQGPIVFAELLACGFEVRAQIIWNKDRLVLGRGHYHFKHEPCYYAVKGSQSHWIADRSQTTVWDIKSRDDEGHSHGTQKPVECMRRPILNNSSPGHAVYDPFCGSGTTIIAAEKEGRIGYGMEIDPRYVDVIVQRWEKFTGKTATLEETGQTFAEVAQARK